MKAIKPIPITDAMIVSSNAVEAYAAWSSGTTYAKDDIVDYGTDYWISLVNTNLNHLPNEVGSTYWAQHSVDNLHAMFDGQVSTATASTSPLIVTVEPGIVNSVAMVGLIGSSVEIVVTDGGASPPVYSKTVNLDGTVIIDWYAYFFEPFVQLGEVALTDLPPYANAQITMTLSSGGNVAIGEFIVGTVYTLSPDGVEQGASVGIIDYSRKTTNSTTGVTTFQVGAFSKRMSVQFLVPNPQINAVQRLLADLRAVPSVYIGSEDADYAPLVVYGFYRDFSIDIAYPTKSWCRLEVEGLT